MGHVRPLHYSKRRRVGPVHDNMLTTIQLTALTACMQHHYSKPDLCAMAGRHAGPMLITAVSIEAICGMGMGSMQGLLFRAKRL
jgi:hypothetical protein